MTALLVAPRPATPCTPPYGPGSADACNINASCVEPLPERRSVMRITAPSVDGQLLGSGVLVNNGLGNLGTPYVVTAIHLLDFDQDGDVTDPEGHHFGQHAEFAFGVESSCGGGSPSPPYVVQGASVVASAEGLDTVLLQLYVSADDLIANAHPYYAGWDQGTMKDLPIDVHAIHHPCGDVKMVSAGVGPDDFNGYVRLAGLACGGVQPGSSGGPLFDTATRNLIALLSGTDAGDAGITPAGEVCAGELTSIYFGPFTDFGFQFLGALDSVPAYDPVVEG